MRKLLALACALALLPTATGLTLAHSTEQYDTRYNDYCSRGSSDLLYSRGYNVIRTSAMVGSRILGAAGYVTPRALWPCIHGSFALSPGYVTKSLLLPANIQSDAANDGAYNFIQAGIGKVHFVDSEHQCQGTADAMINDQTHFVYTPDPVYGQGEFCRATFVDFDNNGVPDDPISGRQYYVWIYETYLTGVPKWRVCFEDMTTLLVDCKYLTRTTRDGGVSGNNAAWWACEAGNDMAAIGVPVGYSTARIGPFRYWKASDKQWYYTENSRLNSPWGTNPSFYRANLDQSGLGETLSCTSASH